MKEFDSLGRRNRYADPPDQPPVGIRLGQFDIEMLCFLHRHGGRLPTGYIFKFFPDRNEHYIRVRLKLLWWHGYLKRPKKQTFTVDPECNELVHEITGKGIRLLQDKGRWSEYAPRMQGPFPHQLFLSCLSASFELECRTYGYEYTPQHVLLERLGHDHTISLPSGKRVAPDQVFMLGIDGKALLLFVEADRETEGIHSNDEDRKSWQRNSKEYAEIIGGGLYVEHFDAHDGALLLVVTVSRSNMDQMIRLTEKQMKSRKCSYMLFAYFTEFGEVLKPPSVLPLLTLAWERAGMNPFRFAVPKDQMQEIR